MNAKTSGSFVEVVNKQTVLYNELKETITAESKALMEKDTKAMEAVIKAEEAGIEKIKALEKVKAVLFIKLAEEAGFNKGDDIKMTDILPKLNPEERAKMEKALTELISALKEVDSINAVNAHLLKNYIEFDGFSKNLKKKMEEPENITYSKTGGKKTEKLKEGPKIDKTI